MLHAVQRIAASLQFYPALSRSSFDVQFLLDRLQVSSVIIEKLLGEPCVFEMQCLGSHQLLRRSSVSAERNCAATSLSACGTTVVLARTGITFVSPSHRGT